jgi:glycosyltransferase involved in cell wall biosynthesis
MKIGILVSDFIPKGESIRLKGGLTLGVGGTELQSYNLAKRFSDSNNVTVFTRRYMGLPFEERRDGFMVKRFRTIKIPCLSFFSHIMNSLILIRKNKPDILQCMMLTPNGLVGVLAGKIFGVKAIPWVRGGDWYLSKGFVSRKIISYVIRNSPVIFVQTEKIRSDILKEFPGKNILVIPNAVETRRKRSSGDKVVYVGNLRERKGIEYLIEAMKGIDSELILVGDGPERSFLESIAGDNVRFVGRVGPDEVERFLSQARMLVLPAKKGEGLPNVILEAMSMGIPVVSTNIAGISDVVKNNDTGFLVKPRDSEQLRKYIKMILENDALRRRMSDNCIKEIRKYSWENMIKRLEKIYSEEICAG